MNKINMWMDGDSDFHQHFMMRNDPIYNYARSLRQKPLSGGRLSMKAVTNIRHQPFFR